MKYQRFEELPVWRAAIKLAVETYALTSDDAFRGQRSLRDQVERAAVSVSNNVAEGFERGTNNELLTFLYIARGSAGEVRSMLCLLERLPAFDNLKFQISKSTAPQQAAVYECRRNRRAFAASCGEHTPQRFEITGREHLAAAQGLGRLFAELRHQGSAVFD